MNVPKVSVAIITYNQKEFLRECLDSIISQDYPDFEVIVSDDASTDGTQVMLAGYAQNYHGRLKLILADKNGGITVNDNRALSACTGKYIAWMGGDDLMLPGKLASQVEFMEANPDCVLSYHDLDVFDSTTGKTLRYFNSGDDGECPQQGTVGKLVQYGTFCGGCSVMVLRAACPREGFDERISIASDWLYYIETAANGGSIRYIPEVLGRYRRHVGNITNTTCKSPDQLITLAIVESKYPHLAGYARKYRARYLYSAAVENVLKGETRLARVIFLESLRQGWVSWKWSYWFLRALTH